MKKLFFITLCITQLNSPHSMEKLWTETYKKAIDGFWGEHESVSGPGSTLEQTKVIQRELPQIIKLLNISSILDVPCGDFNWMRFVDIGSCTYIGADIVAKMIDQNKVLHKSELRTFLHLDATKDILPKCDLIICRDLLVHLSNEDIYKALKNFKKSGAKYLLTTTFTAKQRSGNCDIETGGWQPLNLEAPPFNFPKPDFLINEHCTEQNGNYSDKSLGLWALESLDIKE